VGLRLQPSVCRVDHSIDLEAAQPSDLLAFASVTPELRGEHVLSRVRGYARLIRLPQADATDRDAPPMHQVTC